MRYVVLFVALIVLIGCSGSVCKDLSDEDRLQSRCILSEALKDNDFELCNQINDTFIRQNCHLRELFADNFSGVTDSQCETEFSHIHRDICIDMLHDRNYSDEFIERFFDSPGLKYLAKI